MLNTVQTNVPAQAPRNVVLPERDKRTKIGLLCELTHGNLGNAAFEAAAVQHILAYYPDAQIYISARDSLDTFKEYNVRLFPLNLEAERRSPTRDETTTSRSQTTISSAARPRNSLRKIPFLRSARHIARAAQTRLQRIAAEIGFWARSYALAKEFRFLILCGGGQLSDWWGGPWGHPYRLFMWAALSRLTGTQVIVLNVAVEHVSSPLSRWFLKFVLRQASYRSFRDPTSRQIVEGWGVGGENHVYPDLAFSLQLPATCETSSMDSESRVIGLSPMPYCDPRVWPVKDAAVYENYLETLAAFARNLMDRGYAIMLFASQVRMDVNAIDDLRQRVIGKDANLAARISVPTVRTVDDFLALMPKLDLVVASRMHGLLLAQLVHRPVLAISYDDKVDSLMAGLGLSEFCLDIRKIDVRSLIEHFDVLESKRGTVVQMLKHRVAEYRDALERQYKHVFRS